MQILDPALNACGTTSCAADSIQQKELKITRCLAVGQKSNMPTVGRIFR
jgi:hypothetical protein